jgi:hypothetical protein
MLALHIKTTASEKLCSVLRQKVTNVSEEPVISIFKAIEVFYPEDAKTEHLPYLKVGGKRFLQNTGHQPNYMGSCHRCPQFG